jgi:hypothetical protein
MTPDDVAQALGPQGRGWCLVKVMDRPEDETQMRMLVEDALTLAIDRGSVIAQAVHDRGPKEMPETDTEGNQRVQITDRALKTLRGSTARELRALAAFFNNELLANPALHVYMRPYQMEGYSFIFNKRPKKVECPGGRCVNVEVKVDTKLDMFMIDVDVMSGSISLHIDALIKSYLPLWLSPDSTDVFSNPAT